MGLPPSGPRGTPPRLEPVPSRSHYDQPEVTDACRLPTRGDCQSRRARHAADSCASRVQPRAWHRHRDHRAVHRAGPPRAVRARGRRVLLAGAGDVRGRRGRTAEIELRGLRAPRAGPGGGPSRCRLGWLGLCRRTGGLRGAVRPPGSHLHRPERPEHPPDWRQDLGQTACRTGEGAGHALGRRGGVDARRGLGARAATRLPGRRQGLGGGRRPRHPTRGHRGGPRGGLRRRPSRGRTHLWGHDRLRGAVARGRPPRRGAGAGRPFRDAVGTRCARLHGPASVPEAGGRGPVTGADGERGAGTQGCSPPAVPRGRLSGRRHRGVPVRPVDPTVLVHGGQSAPAGGAPRDGAHDRG